MGRQCFQGWSFGLSVWTSESQHVRDGFAARRHVIPGYESRYSGGSLPWRRSRSPTLGQGAA